MNEDLVYRLRKRAEIRRQIDSRKSVQEGKPDRIADLLEEAANALDREYKEFEAWFYELEEYGTRAERFWDSLTAFSPNASAPNTVIWLKAAFEAGKSINKESQRETP